MRNPDEFPADIIAAAEVVIARGYNEGLVETIARALMERDKAATERALALLNDPPFEALQAMYEAMFVDKWDGTQAAMVGAGFDAAVAAIRSQP